jgi:MFS family permease
MFTGAVIVIIGTCIQAPSVNRGMFLAGRFILGLGVSFACVSAPCYVSEVCDHLWFQSNRPTDILADGSSCMARHVDWAVQLYMV